jgi:translation initiation factor 1
LIKNDNGNLNSIDNALKELDKDQQDILVYQDVKKFNKPVTIIQGLKDIGMTSIMLRELKKNLGTGGTYKKRLIILQGNHQQYVKNYLINKNIIKE